MISLLLKRIAEKNRGFTLIELLIVIIIVGILAAIALPSFLNQRSKANQSEAQSYIGALNRAQQQYYFENNTFGTLEQLDISISDTDNYDYEVVPDVDETIATARPLSRSLTGYAGKVFVTTSPSGKPEIVTLLCEGTANQVPTITGTECP